MGCNTIYMYVLLLTFTFFWGGSYLSLACAMAGLTFSLCITDCAGSGCNCSCRCEDPQTHDKVLFQLEPRGRRRSASLIISTCIRGGETIDGIWLIEWRCRSVYYLMLSFFFFPSFQVYVEVMCMLAGVYSMWSPYLLSTSKLIVLNIMQLINITSD